MAVKPLPRARPFLIDGELAWQGIEVIKPDRIRWSCPHAHMANLDDAIACAATHGRSPGTDYGKEPLMGRPKGSRNYTQAEISEFVTLAVALGDLTFAAEQLPPSRSSLRRWLLARGYRIQQSRILDPRSGNQEPATPRGAA